MPVAALRTLALGYQHLHARRFVPPETFERARLTRAEQTLDRRVTSLYASYLQPRRRSVARSNEWANMPRPPMISASTLKSCCRASLRWAPGSVPTGIICSLCSASPHNFGDLSARRR